MSVDSAWERAEQSLSSLFKGEVADYNNNISGMNKGIRWLSDKNAWMFMGLMILAFLFGPGQWICNLFVESIGDFLGGLKNPNFYEN